MSTGKTRNKPDFDRTCERLVRLTDEAPRRAVIEARRIPTDDPNWRQLRAAILCDAGGAAGDPGAVQESADLFASLCKIAPEDSRLLYNLGNALSRCATMDATPKPEWFLATAELRRKARAVHGMAAKLLQDHDPSFASQLMVNLGNGLDAGHRWVEAFECYQSALELYPDNGVASGCAARTLLRVASAGTLGHAPHLCDVAQRLAHHAKDNADIVAKFAGPAAVEKFAKLPSQAGDLAQVPDLPYATPYERFVTEHRLVLSAILEGPGHHKRRWDDAQLDGIKEGVTTGAATPPPIFAMFNVMKADYLVARELLFQGFEEAVNDTGAYADTLDYAVYGLTPGRLVLAQRAALDLLDKVAVALNDYLHVGLKPKNTHFHAFWRETPNASTWRPALAEAIARGNPAILALSEIAADLSDGSQDGRTPGLLSSEKKARKAGTHRFTVLHDSGLGGFRPCDAVEHHDFLDFQQTALRTLRLARAALLHFVEIVSYEERARHEPDALVAEMLVHMHHEIRGDE